MELQHRENSSFRENVDRILGEIGTTLVEKNIAYGNAVLDPVRVFSKADRLEQINVRIDDKISRIQKGHEYPGDDTIRDLIGYLCILLIARESE